MSTNTEQDKIVRFTADIPAHLAWAMKSEAAKAGKTKNDYVAEVFAKAANLNNQPLQQHVI